MTPSRLHDLGCGRNPAAFIFILASGLMSSVSSCRQINARCVLTFLTLRSSEPPNTAAPPGGCYSSFRKASDCSPSPIERSVMKTICLRFCVAFHFRRERWFNFRAYMIDSTAHVELCDVPCDVPCGRLAAQIHDM